MARPSRLELTPRIEHAIADLIVAGVGLRDAARVLNLGERTLHDWLWRGRNGRARYARFVESIEQAQIERATIVEAAIERARARLSAEPPSLVDLLD